MKATKFLLVAVVFFLVLFTAATGCKVSSSRSGKKEEKTATEPKVSDEEYKRIKSLVQADVISAAPNSVGFMAFYGEVTNGSDRPIRKVQVTVVSTAEKKGADISPAGQIGETVIRNLGPGETKAFNLTSSLESTESSGYVVKVGDIQL